MSILTTLYRLVGPQELALIAASGWTAFPPRLPEQPIFYPVIHQEYAAWISEHWNVRDYGSGFVTQLTVRTEFAARDPVRRVGAGHAEELWVPAEELAEFNANIVGPIELIAQFPNSETVGLGFEWGG